MFPELLESRNRKDPLGGTLRLWIKTVSNSLFPKVNCSILKKNYWFKIFCKLLAIFTIFNHVRLLWLLNDGTLGCFLKLLSRSFMDVFVCARTLQLEYTAPSITQTVCHFSAEPKSCSASSPSKEHWLKRRILRYDEATLICCHSMPHSCEDAAHTKS